MSRQGRCGPGAAAIRGGAAGAALLALTGCGGMTAGGHDPADIGAKPPASITASVRAPLPPGVEAGMLPKGARLTKPDGHLAAITCLSFSPDGKRLVSGSEDRSLLVWDVETGQILQRLEGGHNGFVGACAFLPDGRRVVSAGWAGEIFVWDTVTGERPVSLGRADLSTTDAVYALTVRGDGREVMAGTYNGGVKAWSLERAARAASRSPIRSPSSSPDAPPRATAFNPLASSLPLC